MKKKMTCIVSESGGGKNFLMDAVKEKLSLITSPQQLFEIIPVVSYSTRPIREGEIDGIDHLFVTEEEGHRIMSESKVIAYTKIEDPKTGLKGYEYFATEKSIENANTYIIDPNGIEYLKQIYPEMELFIIYIHTPFLLRVFRARKRSDFKTKFIPRCKNEKEQFKQFRKQKEYDIIIHNLPFFTQYNIQKLYHGILNFFKGGSENV